MSDLIKLKEKIIQVFNGYVETLIPLCNENNTIYFLTKSSQVYGIDDKFSLFEPSTSVRNNIVRDSLKIHLTNEIKKILFEKYNLEFDELVELKIKSNFENKNFGTLFYYSQTKNMIYDWNIFTKLWKENINLSDYKSMFLNSYIMNNQTDLLHENTIKGNLKDFGVEMEDLEELTIRFRDASVYYYHKKHNKIYSKNILEQNIWYIPSELYQNKILLYVNQLKELR